MELADKIISEINVKLSNLTWLETICPAVKVGVRENGDTYPQLYNGKIIDLTPNTKLKSYSFFEKNGYEIATEGGSINVFRLSVVFWVQLKVINSTKLYDFTDELIKDVIHILYNFDAQKIEVKTENCFEKYNLHNTHKQMFMFPFSEFKIDFEVNTNYC